MRSCRLWSAGMPNRRETGFPAGLLTLSYAVLTCASVIIVSCTQSTLTEFPPFGYCCALYLQMCILNNACVERMLAIVGRR